MRRGEYMRRGDEPYFPARAHIRTDKKSDANLPALTDKLRGGAQLSVTVTNTVHCIKIMPMLFDFFGGKR